MRLVLLLTALIISILLFFLSTADYYEINTNLSKFAYEREINLSGNTVISLDNIKEILPWDHSNFWWRMNLNHLQQELELAAIIASVKIQACSFWKINCYNINLRERKPEAITDIERQAWLVDVDGAFLLALPKKKDLEQESIKFQLPLVLIPQESFTEEIASDLLARAIEVLKEIESLTSKKIAKITITSDGEFKVKFKALDLNVTFSNINDDNSEINSEVQRLLEVFLKFQGRLNLLESVDLAYNKLAVVKLKKN